MTALLLSCVECGKGTDTDQSRNGVCRDCIVRKVAKPHRDRLVALTEKRYRYELNGKLAFHNDDPFHRQIRKVLSVLRMVAPWWDGELKQKYLDEIREEAESVAVTKLRGKLKPRIFLPRPGDFAKAVEMAQRGVLSGRATVGVQPGDQMHRRYGEAEVRRENT